MRFLGPSLWLSIVAAALADNVCIPENGHHYNISSQSDIDAMSSCDTVVANIWINSAMAESITLTGVTNLTGYLEFGTWNYSDPGILKTFNMPDLVTLNGSLSIGGGLDCLANISMENLQCLTALDGFETDYLTSIYMPKLYSIAQIQLYNTPFFSDFTTAPLSVLSSLSADSPFISISGTALKSLNFATIADETDVSIKNSSSLTSLTLGFKHLGAGSDDAGWLTVISNNGNLSVNFPNLSTTSRNIQLAQIGSLSIPLLNSINGTFEINYSNLILFSAPSLISVIDQVERIGLSFSDNLVLANISLPKLRNVSDLGVENTKALEYEYGIDVPSLQYADNVALFSDEFDGNCRLWNNLRCQGIIQGDYYYCNDYHFEPYSNPDKCNNDYPLSGMTLSQKLKIGLAVPLSILAIVVLSWSYMRYKRRRAVERTVELELESTEPPKYTDDTAPPTYQEQPRQEGEVSGSEVAPAYRAAVDSTERVTEYSGSATTANTPRDESDLPQEHHRA